MPGRTSHPGGRVCGLLAMLLAGGLACSAQAQGVLAIGVNQTGEIWAAGQRGTLLRSRDGGRSWRAVTIQPDLHVQAIAFDGPSVGLLGGAPVTGLPALTGRARLLRSDDGRDFTDVPAGALPWLYGGRLQGRSAVVAGCAIGRDSSGAWRTLDGGSTWEPLDAQSPGYLRAAAFSGFAFGYLAGANGRILSLRDFRDADRHPAEQAGGLAFSAMAIGPGRRGWCVGPRGQVRTGMPEDDRWTGRVMPLAPGTRRFADFQTVATLDSRVVVGGGLAGQLFLSDDGGTTFRARPAPGPGPVRSLCWLPGGVLLAGGDGGRLWRSDDDAATWQQTAGADRCDVLFVTAAGDLSLYPAILAHSLAGLDTAVVFATSPRTPAGPTDVPPDQPARSAAMTLRAGGVVVLDDFPSTGPDENLPGEALLARWSRSLDADAREALLRQLAAAIRCYRPAVVAVGYPGPGGRGRTAENRLVARLAREAVDLAADAGDFPESPSLPVHRVRRIFAGFAGNERYIPPWQPESPEVPTQPTVAIDGTVWPRGYGRTLAMQSAEAAWQVRAGSLTDRPAVFTAYRCEAVQGRLPLMTTGLATAGLIPRSGLGPDVQMLASGGQLRLAARQDREAAAVDDLIRQARQARARKDEGSAGVAGLACDGLLLAWQRLSERGRLLHACQARDAFLKFGSSHPLYSRVSVAALAMLCSEEYTAALSREGPRETFDLRAIAKAAGKFTTLHPWCDTPAGKMLAARALQVAGKRKKAATVLARLEAGDAPPAYRRSARLELSLPSAPQTAGLTTLQAPWIDEAGKVDGRLDEAFWKTLRPVVLQAGPDPSLPRHGRLAGTLQAFRSVGSLAIGLRLPDRVGVRWEVTVAIDADRDAWTDLRLNFDTQGGRSARLWTRLGPSAKLNARRTFLLQGRRAPQTRELTVELAVPLSVFGRVAGPQAWRFQVRATATDEAGRSCSLFFQPQPSANLQPQRYGLIFLLPAEAGL